MEYDIVCKKCERKSTYRTKKEKVCKTCGFRELLEGDDNEL